MDGYRYETITPISLTAGSTYVIGTYFPQVADRCSTDCGDVVLYNATQTYAAGVTFLQSLQTRSIIGNGPIAFPDVNAGIPEGVFGPNFLITAPETAPVPEPSSLLLCALGACAYGWRRRVRVQ